MECDFIVNSKIKMVNVEDKNFEKKVLSIFTKNFHVIYVLKGKKYYGTIAYKDLVFNNFCVKESIDINYPKIYDRQIIENEVIHILENNDNILFFPVCNENNELIYEYKKNNFNEAPLCIDKKRWDLLYSNNKKISDFIITKKFNKIIVSGKLDKTIKKYIETNTNILCEIYKKNIFELIQQSSNDCLIIDTNNTKQELVSYIINNESNFKSKIVNLLSINNLCDEAELYYFVNFLETNKIKTYFFLCQTPEQLCNLSFEEKLRIAFDKHYRYYFEHMGDENIRKIVEKVLGDLYTPEFISSRNNMSGTILQDGVCFLAPSDNKFCRVIKGLRCTTNHNYNTKNNINMFGPCLFFGPLQDDEHTIPSYIQRLINNKNKDYWVNNYGQRAISMYENIRTCLATETHENDILIFAISPEEKRKLNEYGISNIYPIADMLNGERNFHDYFMGEPVHCNHIANEKIAAYIFSKIKSDLVDMGNTPINNKILIEGKKSCAYKDNIELKKYIKELKKNYGGNKGIAGAVMMNCNPFTNGHYNLIKYASKNVDKLFVFVVQEDRSYFRFEDRFNMVKAGCKEFDNVVVLGSGKVFGSYITFPDYFHRDDNPNVEIDVSMDIELFTEYIAPALNIKKRFVGNEPVDNVTRNYNNQIKKELPKFGIEFIEIPRFEDSNGKIISAKFVRKALEENNWEEVKSMVPYSVLKILEKYRKI